MDDPTGTFAPSTHPGAPDDALMDLLADGIPISLIMDLAMPAGPHSRELLEAEGAPDNAWWEPR